MEYTDHLFALNRGNTAKSQTWQRKNSMKGERQMEAVRTGNKVEMTQGKMGSQRYRTTYTDKNNFADKNKSLFS